MKASKLKDWQRTVEDTAAKQDTRLAGLTAAEAQRRLEKYGHNELATKGKTTLLQKFLAQFKDLMIIVLLVAALISVFVGEGVDALIILLVVVLNAIFGVFQESKAEEAIDALKSLAAPQAKVERDGQIQQIQSTELVPGDVVILEAGDVVPADLRLVESASMQIEESALTGESVPVNKQTAALDDEQLPLGDRTNLAFMNSNVTFGRGKGIVIHTGMATK
jgi:Ca2+-transporting ATPase